METKKKSPSWLSITIWFIFFWPVSVYLIWKRLSNDKAAYMKNSKIIKCIGYVFIFMAVCSLSALVEGDIGTTLTLFLFYFTGGALIIWGSKKVYKSGEMYKKYIDIVINREERTIENIASAMGLSYDQTVNGLQQMIEKGYFEGAYIDHGSHEIVFPRRKNIVDAVPNIEEKTVQQRTVKCPNCGGNNVINVGQSCECDFCGSPIE